MYPAFADEAGTRTRSNRAQLAGRSFLRNVLEDFIRISALIICHIIGCDYEIVACSAVQSDDRVSHDISYIFSLPSCLQVRSWCCAVIDTVTRQISHVDGIPSED